MHRAGFPVLVLEAERPMAIRRGVSLCEAIRLGSAAVEDISALRAENASEMEACWAMGKVPVTVDPQGGWIGKWKPACVVDAIMAKRNQGTHRAMADVVIGVGPGFTAGNDVHAVIETMRGHNLGRLILTGAALSNTGVPGELGGKSVERVIYAPAGGKIRHVRRIGDTVKEGEAILTVDGTFCAAPFDGLLRGLIAEGSEVRQGMKIADVDPRMDADWQSISDKARCIGGAVLEAYLALRSGRE
ncbi:MAG: selenium-dependent molybdenum cofactor biosynthesis protein YqeB [Clostridia bacterium]|nr:selenium-dependent molybdenum cofactor biosynthesis protein YqeB [Clostridia bacterium]